MAKPLINNLNLNSTRSILKTDSTEGRYWRNQEILVDGWLTQANKDTTDYPAPIEVGELQTLLPELPPFALTASLSTVWSGHDFTFTSSGELKSIEVWIPTVGANVTYRVIIVDYSNPNSPKTSTISNFPVQQNQWVTVMVGDAIVTDGTRLLIFLESINSASTTDFNYDWTYEGTQNTAAPQERGWNRTSNHAILRIDKSDLTGTDRSVDLLSVVPGTTINTVQTSESLNYWTYIVNAAPIDQGTYVEYSVSLTDSGGAIVVNQSTTISFSIPVPAPTDYNFADDYWLTPANLPDFATVQGFLAFDGVDQNQPNDAFGINVDFQKLDISPDWTIKSYSPELVNSTGAYNASQVQVELTSLKPILRAQSAETYNLSTTPVTLAYESKLQCDWFIVDTATNTEITALQNGNVHFDLDLNVIADDINESKIWIVYLENDGVSWDIIHTANQYYEANRRSSGYTAFTHVIKTTKLYKYKIQILLENTASTSIESVSYNSGIGMLTTPSINLTLIGIK